MPAQQQAVDVACNLSDQRDYKFTDYHMTKIFYFFLLFLIISCDTNLDNKRQENLPEPKQVVIKRYYLKKKNYKLEYLFTWTIDSSDKKMDPDNSVTINSPHDGSISFMTFNKPLDEREQIQQLINEDLNNSMKNGQVSRFTKWGSYVGQGAKIIGKLQGKYDSEASFFAYSSDTCSFICVSHIFDSNKAEDDQGLKLIENTFKLRQ